METDFSKEQLKELEQLTARFVFENVKFVVQRTGITLNTQEIVNDASRITIESIGKQISNKIKQKSECDFDSESLDNAKEVEKLMDRKKFLLLLIKFKKNKEQIEKDKKDLAQLESELKILEEQSKTPQELMEEKREKIKTLKQKIN